MTEKDFEKDVVEYLRAYHQGDVSELKKELHTERRLFRVFNKETGKTMCWFNDSEDLFYMVEWYSDSEIKYGVEKYELVDEW